MKRVVVCVLGLVLVAAGCGKGKAKQEADGDWAASPSRVIQGLEHAYQARNDSLYAALLAPDFHYYFEPVGADSADILGWDKNEEVVATSNLFHTPDIDTLTYTLQAGEPENVVGQPDWKAVPVSGGEMLVVVKNKDPMRVKLNRQELVMRPVKTDGHTRWEIVQWHDYPNPASEEGSGGATPAASPDGQ